METGTKTNNMLPEKTDLLLKPAIDKLINSLLPASIFRRNLIINDVRPGASITLSENTFALVIGNIICNAVSATLNDCLYIRYLENGEIQLHLNSTNLSRNKSFVVNLETILVIADRMGVNLRINEHYNTGTDISVLFVKNAA